MKDLRGAWRLVAWLGAWGVGGCGSPDPSGTSPPAWTDTASPSAGTTATTGTTTGAGTTAGGGSTATTPPTATGTTGGTTATTDPLADLDGDGWTPADGDCDDGDAAVHPGAAEVCGNGIDDDCDGQAWTCTPWTQDMAAEDADLLLRASSMTGELGRAVVVAGDLDGDGADDLLVGAPASSYASPGGGMVLALPADGAGTAWTDAALVARVTDGHADDSLGDHLAAGRDLTGDGVPDVAAAAPFSQRAFPWAGAVYVLPGPLAGEVDVDDAALALYGEVEDAHLGLSLAMAGDLTGDGQPELVVGEYAGPAGDGWGAVLLVEAPVPGDVLAVDAASVVVQGRMDGAFLGEEVEVEADMDGDGLDDLVVSSPGEDGADASSGAVFVFLAPVTGALDGDDADATVEGEQYVEFLGRHMDAGGDSDGDGLDDLLVGGPWWSADDMRGRVARFSGLSSGHHVTSDADLVLEGDADNQLGGYAVELAPGLDGGTRAALVLGVSGSRLGEFAGKLWVVPGDLTGTVRPADVAVASVAGTAGDELGDVALAADLDASGAADLVVAAPGARITGGGDGLLAVFRGGGI